MKTKKKEIMAIWLGCIIFFTSFNFQMGEVYADNVQIDMVGKGTEENPYQVSTAEQLNEVRNHLNACYIQTRDINLSVYDNWDPIGRGDSKNDVFKGKYDGNNYVIRGLNITDPKTRMIGLFGGCSSNAEIQNVYMENMKIKYNSDYKYKEDSVVVGGIVGGYIDGDSSKDPLIKNCTVKGDIEVLYTGVKSVYVGGIVGCGTAAKCHNYATILANNKEINGYSAVGGITGLTGTVYGKVTSCKNYGKIQSNSTEFLYIGGIAGEDGDIKQCINYGDITGTVCLDTVNCVPATWSICAGGIVGKSSGNIVESANYGNVESYSDRYLPSAGGIAGCIGFYAEGKISNCYSLGKNITAKEDRQNGHANRIAGVTNGYSQIFYSNYAINSLKINDNIADEKECEENTINGKTIEQYPKLDYESDENEDSLKKVRYASKNLKKYYGAQTYNMTKEAEIQDAAIEFKKASNQYIDALKDEVGNGNEIVDVKKLAKELREEDESQSNRYITMQSNIPENEKDAVYESVYYAFAEYMNEIMWDKVYIGNIDPSKKTTEIAAQIVQSVRNGMCCSGKRRYEYGKYKVTFDTTDMWGTQAGKITVEKTNDQKVYYTGTIVSKINETKKVLTIYLDELSQNVKDLSKYALFQVVSKFADVTEISSFSKEEMTSFFSDKVEILQKKGYGNVLECFVNIRDVAKITKQVTYASKGINLTNALRNSENIYKCVSELDFSKEGVKKKAVKYALEDLEKARKILEIKLYNKIYNEDKEYEEGGGFFSKLIKSWKVSESKCPVDVEVYDIEGKLIGYVDSLGKHDEYVYYSDDIYIEVLGDIKRIYVPNDKVVSIKWIATKDGTMDYTIEDIHDNEKTGRLNYYDIPLKTGETYYQQLSGGDDICAEKDKIVLSGRNEEIHANEYLSAESTDGYVTVYVKPTEGGAVIGEGEYPRGESVELNAVPQDESYKFSGWYVGDTIVSLSENYRFTVKSNVSIRASFEKKKNRDTKYTSQMADSYVESYADLYVGEAENDSVMIKLQPNRKKEDINTVCVIGYDHNKNEVYKENFIAEQKGDYEYWTNEISVGDMDFIEIYDINNDLIAVFSKNGENSGETKPGESAGGNGESAGGNGESAGGNGESAGGNGESAGGSGESAGIIPGESGGVESGGDLNSEKDQKVNNSTPNDINKSVTDDINKNQFLINNTDIKYIIMAPSKKIAAGKKVQLTVKHGKDILDNNDIVWKSNNVNYATINEQGSVIFKKDGVGKMVLISAYKKDAKEMLAKIKIRIMKNAVTKVKIKNVPSTMKSGEQINAKAIIKTNGTQANKTVVWTTSNKKYMSVNDNGKIIAKKAGKGKVVTLTVTATDGSEKKATVKIKIE